MNDINKLVELLQSHFKWNLARVKCLSSIIVNVIKLETLKLSSISAGLNAGAKQSSNYRRIQRFFKDFDIDYRGVSRFILNLLPLNTKYVITLDRTNWQFGSTDINILMLGVVYNNITVPLIWELLAKRGNSSAEERINIVKKAIDVLGKDRIRCIVADREFIGKKWFKYLITQGIDFHIRVPKSIKIFKYKTAYKSLKSLFTYFKINVAKSYPCKYLIFDLDLYVSGMKKSSDEYFLILSSSNPEEAFAMYRKRWTIEQFFSHIKTKGFNIEATHLSSLEKIKKLLSITAIAFIWCYLVGLWLEETLKIKLLTNKKAQISVFKKGLNYLRTILLNLQYKLDEFLLLANFLSCG